VGAGSALPTTTNLLVGILLQVFGDIIKSSLAGVVNPPRLYGIREVAILLP
jgi:hypothetical protein